MSPSVHSEPPPRWVVHLRRQCVDRLICPFPFTTCVSGVSTNFARDRPPCQCSHRCRPACWDARQPVTVAPPAQSRLYPSPTNTRITPPQAIAKAPMQLLLDRGQHVSVSCEKQRKKVHETHGGRRRMTWLPANSSWRPLFAELLSLSCCWFDASLFRRTFWLY
jgi:hypothetical protein